MNIYTLLQIGEFHTNHCEDFLITEPISKYETLIAVLDGCTMGRESVFASVLYGKILRKIAKSLYYQEFINKESNTANGLKTILSQLVGESKQIKNQLGLEKDELLSTLILGIVNHEKSNAKFITIGDGLIYADGKITEYEQNNTPDYIGYHIHDDFEEWYHQQKQILSVDTFSNLSICTDGIFTFQNLQKKQAKINNDEIINYFLKNDDYSDNSKMLERKIRELKDQKNLVVTDDLAIIRIIN